MSIDSKALIEEGTPRYLASGDPDLADYYPAWLDNIADDATVVDYPQCAFEGIEPREKNARIQTVRPQQLSMIVVVRQTRGQYGRAFSRCHDENRV